MTTAMTESAAAGGMMALIDSAEKVQDNLANSHGMRRAIAMADGILSLKRSMSDEVVAVLTALCGNPMGFRTDKDTYGKPYDVETVKSCAIMAMLHGAQLVDDEFQIIAGQCYLGQKFYMRKLREYPGVSDVQVDVDIPETGHRLPDKDNKQNQNFVMLVGGYASCKVEGVKVEVFARKHPQFGDSRFAVVAFQAGIDMAQGKAKKRLYQKLYERVAGVEITDGDEGAAVQVLEDGEGTPAIVMTPRDEPAVDWQAELLSHGGAGSRVFEIGVLLRDAKTAQDRADVLTDAKDFMKDGKIDQRGFDTLRRYAESKA